jgi:indolepyruvate ferredoxin oxidoreductase alpha subunit
MIEEFAARHETLYVVEDLDPRHRDPGARLGIACHGKDVVPPRSGVSPEVLRGALALPRPRRPAELPARPAASAGLCVGCPHGNVSPPCGTGT